MFNLTETERKDIDHQLEAKLEWAAQRSIEAEQLSLDAARLLSGTEERLNHIKAQGFFKRCWGSFSGANHSLENANVADLIDMQKKSYRFINLLQERDLMLAHSMLALKNNLLSLAVHEESTRNMVGLLAERTRARFEALEGRMEQLEISQNLQGWLLALQEREYDEKYPTCYIRLLRVVNDFFKIKAMDWNMNDFFFMRNAIRTVQLDPKSMISMGTLIDSLIDEIEEIDNGLNCYTSMIHETQPSPVMDNYSKFILENISGQVFCVVHGLNHQYSDRLDMVETLRDELNCDQGTALKRMLRRTIANMNVNLDVVLPLPEVAFEMLACMRMAQLLASGGASADLNSDSATLTGEQETVYANIDESPRSHEQAQEETPDEEPSSSDGTEAESGPEDGIDLIEINAEYLKDAVRINSLIRGHKSFQVTGIKDMSRVVKALETWIENQGMKVRVYTEYRSAAIAGLAIPTGVTNLFGLGTAIAIGVHNLATFNPDYEIAKNEPMSRVQVIYKKD